MSINKFVTPGFLLSIDLFLVSFVNWIYWLLISKITSASEVGQATAVYSFAFLTSAITLLGLEYSLVKRSSSERSHILGTAITIELLFTGVSIPFLFYSLNTLYQGSLYDLSLIAIGIVIFSSQRYILRYALLGISDAKSVLRVNLMGTALQLISGYTLVTIGFGAAGILLSYLLDVLFVTGLSLLEAKKSFQFCLGELKYMMEIFKDALTNAPTPLAKATIYGLSVVLLALSGVPQSEIGIFYIALMLSMVAGGFAANIAFMAIPVSSDSRIDMSTDSIRIGLTLTAPLIVALMVAPNSILSLIGHEYASAEIILMILSAAIFPHTIIINAISKFNNLGKPKQIVAVGSIHLLVFLLSFTLLVPSHGTLGAGISILVASIASALPSIIWTKEGLMLRYIFNSIVATVSGLMAGYGIGWIFGPSLTPSVAVLSSVAVVIIVIFVFKNTSASELLMIAKGVAGRHP
jgi:O-antigen/teichoic acid export membrane protein